MQMPSPASGRSAHTPRVAKRHSVAIARKRMTRRVRGADRVRRHPLDQLPDQAGIGRVDEEEHRRIEGDRLRRQSLTAIHAVESGSSDIEKRCAK